MGLIVLSIPIFFLLIGLELLISKLKHLPYYRFNDAITNLSCGIGSQVIGILIKALTVGGYIFIYNFSPWKGKIPTDWWMWILLWFAVDFFYYWFHRLAHQISILWGSHEVHHQSEEYNLTVALRQAWLQGAFSWVFYLPLAIIGFEPQMFFTIAAINTLYQFWIHTRLIGKLHPVVEYVFNTPSHHRVHHGINPKYIDKNHGGTFIIYDRLFGTFQAEQEEVVYGITTQPKSFNPLWLNFNYWSQLFKNLSLSNSILNTIKMLFLNPGWKPAELGGVEPFKEITPEQFNKYNPPVSNNLSYYVLLQYILLIIGTSVFLFSVAKPPFSQKEFLKLAVIVYIIFSVVNIGGLLEKKRWVNILEIVRLILLPALVFLIIHSIAIVLCAIIITALSLFVLKKVVD